MLDPVRGIAALLAAYRHAEPLEAKAIDGIEAYRYQVNFDGDAFTAFLPAAGDWNNATVWFDTETLLVLKAEFTRLDQTITLNLTDYNADVIIEHP